MAVTPGRRRGARFVGEPKHIFAFSERWKSNATIRRQPSDVLLQSPRKQNSRNLVMFLTESGSVYSVFFHHSENPKMCIGSPKKRAPLRRPGVTAIARASLFVNHTWLTNPNFF